MELDSSFLIRRDELTLRHRYPFEPIFSQGRNAPAHCVPGVLDWLDRADIAGLNAPRPLMLPYAASPADGWCVQILES